MKIYQENGYLDFEEIMNLDSNFIFILGERACGKTYGFMKYMYEHGEKYLFMRRTQQQCDIVSKKELTPFKSVAMDNDIEYTDKVVAKGVKKFYEVKGDEVRNELFVNVALSTIGNLNGFDASDYDFLFFDEFIARPNERPMKDEADIFFHAYESINRNRELKGRRALKCIFAANSFNIATPIFLYLGIVNKLMKVFEKGDCYYTDKNKGYTVILSRESRIAQAKKETALYKLVGENSDFTRLSLATEFMNEKSKNIKRLNIAEFIIITKIGEIAIYRHKSRNIYYITTLVSGVPKETFLFTDMDKKRFRKNYIYIWWAHLDEKVWFETYTCQVLLEKAFNKS